MSKPLEDLHLNSGICSLQLKTFLQIFLSCTISSRIIQVHGRMISFTNLSTLSGLDPTMVSFIGARPNQSMFHPWDNLVKLFLGNRNMVYGGNVGPQASRNYAKRIQETYDQFYRYESYRMTISIQIGYPTLVKF